LLVFGRVVASIWATSCACLWWPAPVGTWWSEALDEHIPIVCIDERKGRRAALAVGLVVTGTLGILGRAKALGLLPSVRPHVEKMVAGGDWFDPTLLARFYTAMGE
jgi:uncharacterized protein